jgi:hypothetical protein
MFCPVCESEYEAGVITCPDDNTALVERLNPETTHDDSEARFVILHHVGSPAEAEMVNDILRQNDIRSAIQSGNLDALSPLLSSVAPGAAVLVDERDYDRALELYQAFFGEDTTPLTGSTGEEGDEEEGDEEDQ